MKPELFKKIYDIEMTTKSAVALTHQECQQTACPVLQRRGSSGLCHSVAMPCVSRKEISPQGPAFSSVQFSRSVVSDSLWPHELQHARPPCPSQTPGVYSNSCPSSRWCHPAISSSVVPFSSYPQSLPASGSFPMSQLFSGGGQSTWVSASASVLPMNTQDWSPIGWTVPRVFSNTTVQKSNMLLEISAEITPERMKGWSQSKNNT